MVTEWLYELTYQKRVTFAFVNIQLSVHIKV
jgi:hypothetical protein